MNLFLVWSKELNLLSVKLNELNFFQKNMTQRMERCVEKKDKKSIFSNMIQRIEPLLVFQYDSKNWTFFFFQHDSKNWFLFFFWLSLKDLNFFFEYDSKNRTFVKKWPLFHMTPWIFLITQKNWTLFDYDTVNWTLFSLKIQRIEPFFHYDSKNWTFFFFMTQRHEPSSL